MIIFKNNISQKSISSILIIAVILLIISPILFSPKKTNAQCPVIVAESVPVKEQTWIQRAYQAISKGLQKGTLTQGIITAGEVVWDNSKQLVEWSMGVFGNILMHQIFAQLTNDITNWIENGTEPRFMTEGLESYLSDAVDNATGNFIDQYLGAGWLCEEFDLDIKIALLDVPTFETQAKCSLSDIIDNIDDFYNDFSRGGWEGWLEITKPQNNFYGALLLAQGEMERVAAEAEEENKADIQAGNGFLGVKDCTWYDASNKTIVVQRDVRGTPKLPDACKPNTENKTPGLITPCRVECETLTPSTVLNKLSDKIITQPIDSLNAALTAFVAKSGPLAVYVQAIANSLINRITKEGMGLIKGDPISSPSYGDTGASSSIPDIVNPESVLVNNNSVIALNAQLNLNKENLEQELLTEQTTNLGVLELITPAYLDAISNLENVVSICTATSYGSYVDWANTKIIDINNNIIPANDQKIVQMETIDIPKTIDIINKINTTLILIQEYINKSDNWLLVYEEVNGELNNLQLNQAKTEMDQAENEVIIKTQEILTLINGAALSTNIEGLTNEAMNANITIIGLAINLEEERGSNIFPGIGTLYAELENTDTIKSDADTKTNTCQIWIAQQNNN